MLQPLRKALELDASYYVALTASDSDFDLVREDERFRALLDEFSS
jgi:hypothetical protein